MIPDDLIITRRSSERPICRVTIEALVRSDTLFAIDTPSSMERWPYLRGSGRVFSSRSLLGLPRLSNKCVTNQFILALARNEPVCINYQSGKQEWLWCLPSLRCTRLLSLQCVLSLQDLLPLLQEYTKSTGSLKITKKLRLT